MKILKKKISWKKGIGFLQVMAIEEEDFWHLYNLIQKGDLIRTSTYRKIAHESIRSVLKVQKLILELRHQKEEEQFYYLKQLKSTTGPNNIYSCLSRVGIAVNRQYHTMEFDLNVPITIYKENWDQFHYRQIEEITHQSASSDVGALVMEEGVAHLCYITSSTTLLRNKIMKNVCKKKTGNELREKSLREFYQVCLQAIDQEQMLDKVKCLIIASPGFVKDEFLKYVKEQSEGETYKQLSKNLNKILLCKSSTGYLTSLIEILGDPTVQIRLSDTKALAESKVLDQFFKTLRFDPNKVAYGQKDVQFVHQQKAIQVLLMSDKIARTKDLAKRKNFIQLMDEVKRNGGETHIFSSLHPTGQKLNNFTGIAAILFFPIILDYDQEDDEDDTLSLQQQPDEDKISVLNEDLSNQFDDFDSDFM